MQKQKRFGRLTLLHRVENIRNNRSYLCQCDCGNTVKVPLISLKIGRTKSCGCLHREIMKAYYLRSTLPDNGSALNALIGRYKQEAAERDLCFKLGRSQLDQLFKAPCAYCASPPENKIRCKKSVYVYSGIDRINNQKGYTRNNVVSCCSWCQNAKLNGTIKEFYAWLERLHLFQLHPAAQDQNVVIQQDRIL